MLAFLFARARRHLLSLLFRHRTVMKYPQLVSSRAVSEISDWLIKRLEDLDIEQPSVYSRLLLSLLHTPFKVNAIDLLEIPQLKVKFNYSIHSLPSPLSPVTQMPAHKSAFKKSSCDDDIHGFMLMT